MQPSTVVQLSDVAGLPRIKLPLPVPLRVGDRVRLTCRVRRQNGGRSEVLDVDGEYRVTAAGLSVDHQVLAVESCGKAPSWRAVRKEPVFERQLPPARFPPTVL
jgi:hypothetical protein